MLSSHLPRELPCFDNGYFALTVDILGQYSCDSYPDRDPYEARLGVDAIHDWNIRFYRTGSRRSSCFSTIVKILF